MPDDPSIPDPDPIIIVLRQDANPKSEKASQSLEEQLTEHGVTDLNLDRLPLFGIITGNAPADQLDALRALPAVESVEPDETMHLRDNNDSDPAEHPGEAS